MANASGPDISFYQDNSTTPQRIDFVKMKTISDFIIIRVSERAMRTGGWFHFL